MFAYKFTWLLLLFLLVNLVASQSPADPSDDVLTISSTVTVYQDATGGILPPGVKPTRPSTSFFEANKVAIICGSVGGFIALIGIIIFVIYKIRQSNRKWEDEEYMRTSANPFKQTLDQYHTNRS